MRHEINVCVSMCQMHAKYVCMRVSVCMRVCMYANVCVCVGVSQVDMHTDTHMLYTHTHTLTHTCVCVYRMHTTHTHLQSSSLTQAHSAELTDRMCVYACNDICTHARKQLVQLKSIVTVTVT